MLPYGELLEEILFLVREDAEYFDCVVELEHARAIVERGTSAHWQMRTYQDAIAGNYGDSLLNALNMAFC
uniref:Uncharacterized protein n=1 Tax=Candidatus Kentrum sp. SD TaxID=2126332 RepID=A0A451BR86_9GAMM|nr:MAG: hypothetical protein BECKSD772D_GA0070982_11589 [Candidatus Kentron sp. SD]